ncbi:MAG: tetratricopeptide repeat protein [Rhizobiaceae bacterium]|nr:tetratricopeptide repeat protein [Rhizobiaceae bacterium]
MTNNNDLFIREVDEELRNDQFKSIWRRFGPLIIGGALLVVGGVAGWVGYDYWQTSRANASGDRFLAALDQARDGNTAEALTALQSLQADGTGAYPMLAKLRAAGLQAETDAKAAIAAFDAFAADTSVPQPLRDIARLRAAYLLVDNGTYEEVAQRAELLSADGNPLRHSAREAMGLAAWKAQRDDDARRLFGQIADDPQAPRGVAERAGIMLALIGEAAAS